MNNRRIFTVKNNEIELGAIVETLISGGRKIPVIFIGEATCPNGLKYVRVILPNELAKVWQVTGNVRIQYARLNDLGYLIGSTQPIFTQDECITIFKTGIGQGGKNKHLGDVKLNLKAHLPFPGRILQKGKIVHYYLGSYYSGEQLIAIIPKNTIISVHTEAEMEQPKKTSFYFLFNGCYMEKISRKERLSYALKFKQEP